RPRRCRDRQRSRFPRRSQGDLDSAEVDGVERRSLRERTRQRLIITESAADRFLLIEQHFCAVVVGASSLDDSDLSEASLQAWQIGELSEDELRLVQPVARFRNLTSFPKNDSRLSNASRNGKTIAQSSSQCLLLHRKLQRCVEVSCVECERAAIPEVDHQA